MSSISVIDPRSHPQDVIALAARVLSKSLTRREVFRFVYRGKRKRKRMEEILAACRSPKKTVYSATKSLSNNHLIHEVTDAGKLSYEKEGFLDAHKGKILSLAADPKKLARFPTPSNPVRSGQSTISLRISSSLVKVRELSFEEVDEFSRVRAHKTSGLNPRLRENAIKQGFQRILRERGRFRDWGGEHSDLLARVHLRGKAHSAAFAFKGRATKGRLTPRQMGRNADQIQRLFASHATVFFVQYSGQIDESVLEQMRIAATAKSYSTGQLIYYGVIDGAGTGRLMAAYPAAFRR